VLRYVFFYFLSCEDLGLGMVGMGIGIGLMLGFTVERRKETRTRRAR